MGSSMGLCMGLCVASHGKVHYMGKSRGYFAWDITWVHKGSMMLVIGFKDHTRSEWTTHLSVKGRAPGRPHRYASACDTAIR